MAESTPIARVLGVIPGGGSVFRASQISGTDAANRGAKNELGTQVWGYDASGYRGRWVWCLAGGALTAGQVLMIIDNTSVAAPTAATQFTVTQCAASASTTISTGVAGIIETTAASGEYIWLRTHGFYPTLATASHTAVANETSYVGPVNGGTAGIAVQWLGTMTMSKPFATCVKDGSTVTSAPAYLHCYVI